MGIFKKKDAENEEIKKEGKELIKQIELFDVYKDDKINSIKRL